MAALTKNREVDRYVDQDTRLYKLDASVHVYKGAFVGEIATGYARPLVAGDKCLGIAYEEKDNSSGAAGTKLVRVFTLGDFEHALASAGVSDIGRPVYASDDNTLTFDPDGNSFVGYVQDSPSSGNTIVRLEGGARIDQEAIAHHAASFSLTSLQSGTVHTNLGAVAAVVATLPQSPPKGTFYKFVCMVDQEVRLEPGAAGGIYIKGAKQADDKYVSITDIGDYIHLVADGNGDWVALASISGADADITVEA